MKATIDYQNTEEIHDGYRWVEQNCPICGIPPTKFLGVRGGEAHRDRAGVKCEIWCCEQCSLIFPNPMPIPVGGAGQHYDTEAEHFFDNHNHEKKDESAKELLAQAEKLLGRKGKLLDVGAGRGETVRRAKLDGWDVTGVEPTASFADFAEKYSGTKIRREPVEKCGFADEEFDVVILAAVLEHLYNPSEVVGEISRILKRGGLFFFDIPNEKGLFFKIGNTYQRLHGRNWCVNLSPTFPPFHLFGFSPKSIKALLKKHNLEIKTWRIYGGHSMVPSSSGIVGKLESKASKVVTAMSNLGEMGSYIEAWAVRK
ncbi:MAG TPA: class I SAM-dependent methyltransferase [Pyrinomonadaceae bacterium]|nr:class I SAM-dependent methyltransferase [Pyrinomonadaceae bacterium]